MSAYLLRECTMRYEVQILTTRSGWRRAIAAPHYAYGADKNGLFLEREDAERCAKDFSTSTINEVEVPPDYNGEQDHA
jgi:hypothetical protein